MPVGAPRYGISMRRRDMRPALVCALVSLVALAAGFLVFTSLVERRGPELPRVADGIVALTGGEARIEEAIRLLDHGLARRLFISGVHERTSKSALLRHSPEYQRLFNCCIDLGWEARDTVGNAAETSEWARQRGFKSIIIVTSSYHMPRSLIELRRAMPEVELIAYPVVSSGFRIERWWLHPPSARLLLSEYVKLLPAAARLVVSRLVGEQRSTGTALADPMRYPKL